jgi:type II secretory pathway pseudopilin PulG
MSMLKLKGSALIEAMIMTVVVSISLASGLSMVQLTQTEVRRLQARQHALEQLQAAQNELLMAIGKGEVRHWQPPVEAITLKQEWHSARQATFWLAHANLEGIIPIYLELTTEDLVEY